MPVSLYLGKLTTYFKDLRELLLIMSEILILNKNNRTYQAIPPIPAPDAVGGDILGLPVIFFLLNSQITFLWKC